MSEQLNVYGQPLKTCSLEPVTGFFRTGCCETGPEDRGLHLVCARMTDDFLAFSKACGNDLSTPIPQFGFSGLKEGDRWCLCVTRWVEAYEAGAAPFIDLEATHVSALEFVDLETLEKYNFNALN